MPNDSLAAVVQSKLVTLVTSADTEVVSGRTAVKLPALAASDVQFVTDSTTCAGVANALAAITPGGDPSPAAWVFRLGPTRYVAYNFRQKFHGSAYIYVFDQRVTELSSWIF